MLRTWEKATQVDKTEHARDSGQKHCWYIQGRDRRARLEPYDGGVHGGEKSREPEERCLARREDFGFRFCAEWGGSQ